MSEYNEFINYISSLHHPTYEINGIHYQWGLDGIKALDTFLDNPSKKLKIIHVAGTNGKGSCSSFIAAILISHGLKVGTYNSPQLFDIRERIKINGEMISQSEVLLFYEKLKLYNEQATYDNLPKLVSYSEVFVEMAFDFFAKRKVDIAIIETGIGGRLDPTNIIEHPLLSVITSIGKDHIELFGDSLERIAYEKCGIIKNYCPVVVGAVPRTVANIIQKEANKNQSKVYFTENYYNSLPSKFQHKHDYSFDLLGQYQALNIQTTLCAIALLEELYPGIVKFSHNNILCALRNTAKIMRLRGRWEILNIKPTIIADICSNPLGLRLNIQQLLNMMISNKQYHRLVFIIGLTSINKIDIRDELPRNAKYIYTQSKSYISSETLAKEIGVPGEITYSVEEAIALYLSDYRKNDLVYIGGSIHVVADAISIINNLNFQ